MRSAHKPCSVLPMSHRKQKVTKQQPGTAGPGYRLGCCLVSLRFLCDLHSIHSVVLFARIIINLRDPTLRPSFVDLRDAKVCLSPFDFALCVLWAPGYHLHLLFYLSTFRSSNYFHPLGLEQLIAKCRLPTTLHWWKCNVNEQSRGKCTVV